MCLWKAPAREAFVRVPERCPLDYTMRGCSLLMIRLLVLTIALLGCLAAASNAASLGFSSADFTILSEDGSKALGSVHYQLDDSHPGLEIVTSLARYNDGQYDVERDEFNTSRAADPPPMSAYDHSFFHPDRRLWLEAKANFATGEADCIQYYDDQPATLTKTLSFPPDTYAGAALMLPLRKALKAGEHGPIVMHDFACIPGPHLVRVEAYAQPPASWEHYPGEVVHVKVKPDFGWLDYLIAPFVPRMHAWFSPADDFHLVGAKFSRYYKGPEIILARRSEQHEMNASGRR